MTDKRELRQKVRMMKRLLSEEEKQAASVAAFERLEQTAAFQLADRILIYNSLPDEVYTPAFIKHWESRKQFYLPRVNGDDLDILPYNGNQLEIGSFNIEEPTGDDIVDISEIELIIVPGMAFDKKGNRCGRGKGYYDRLLKTSLATKIGIAYHFQISEDDIPTEAHDIPMDIVISDRCTIVIKKN